MILFLRKARTAGWFVLMVSDVFGLVVEENVFDNPLYHYSLFLVQKYRSKIVCRKITGERFR